ncbi:hypothetical protein MesoLjLc_34640 [Mesorhizobium sp. L-8-10]|uniref:NAD(P)-dependent oxidoreductase n=1 Tax=Mesorhizobium sp. L-8-10 TaxID=2744523 RepID=UPI001928064F|nr:NAD(P)-dependent oxidoreductase [Mesorhizobium sp. L-8-10]BCH31534.1 hypothetical protein MesoLjLc_34640 [Mesorhizobium sp. L-8-10]
MTTNRHKPVLIIGGSGIVGSTAARTLRQLYPELPITIGGRDLAKAEAVAKEIGNARGAAIDLDRIDLGLPAGDSFGAVVPFLKDETLNSLKYAQATGAGYLSISSGVFELGPETAFYIHKPTAVPVVMASSWLAGVATFPTLRFAKEFSRIDRIEITAVLDEQDMGGPAAAADFERLTRTAPRALIVKDGKFVWAADEDASRTVVTVDGVETRAIGYSPFDVLSLAAATDAKSIRFDLIYGESANRRRGEHFSTETIIEITGENKDGRTGLSRYELVHPRGQAPVTAVGVTLGIERLLGLDGKAPAAPGLYLPEVLIDPDHAVRRFQEFGLLIAEK